MRKGVIRSILSEYKWALWCALGAVAPNLALGFVLHTALNLFVAGFATGITFSIAATNFMDRERAVNGLLISVRREIGDDDE